MGSNNEYNIRVMTSSDLDAVTDIASGCFLVPWQKSDFEFSIKAEHDIDIVAECDNKVIGFCILRCSVPQGDVIDVAVAPEARGAGIGTAMIKKILLEGRKYGVSEFMLEVRVSNSPAIRLYKNVGFKQIGIRKQYYSTPVEDAIIMQCVFQ